MANGAYSVEDIKGSNTFSQIEEYYGVPVAALAEAFGVEEAKAADFASKDVSSLYPAAAHAVNNNTVKAFVAFYTGAPVDLADGSVYLPQTAADAVLRDGAPTEDQKAYIASHTFDPNATDGASAASSGSDSASGPAYKAAKPAQSATSIDLTGGNTFVEVSSAYGIPAEDLSSAFGLSAEQYAFFQMKDLKTLYAQSPQAIGPASVKLFVALYAGYDYDLSVADTYLPRSAMDVLKQHGGLTPNSPRTWMRIRSDRYASMARGGCRAPRAAASAACRLCSVRHVRPSSFGQLLNDLGGKRAAREGVHHIVLLVHMAVNQVHVFHSPAENLQLGLRASLVGVGIHGCFQIAHIHTPQVVFDQHAVLNEALGYLPLVGKHVIVEHILFFAVMSGIRIGAYEADDGSKRFGVERVVGHQVHAQLLQAIGFL